jgi:hypothetical protein
MVGSQVGVCLLACYLTFKFTRKSILCYEGGTGLKLLKQCGSAGRLAGLKSNQFRTFVEAREYVRKLRLKGWADWNKFSSSGERPVCIPSTPHRQYKDEWISIRDWLGLPEVKKTSWLTFRRARAMVRKKRFKSQAEFRLWVVSKDAPFDLPRTPRSVYAGKGWKGWAHFLGNRHFGKRGRRFRSFRSARVVVRRLRLTGWKEWRVWAASDKRPADIPAQPAKIYHGKGWISVGDWLGYKGRFSGARFVSKETIAERTLSRHRRAEKLKG